MEIVARAGRRALAGLLIAAIAFGATACEPTASGSPGASPAVSAGVSPASSTAACANAPLPGSAPPAGDPPPWTDRIFYEVFVRSFADGDGDGIGDLLGLTERLDYLNDGDPATTDDLGVTGIWLMPVAEAVSYHGYDVTDYGAIEHDYGDQAAFEAFIAAAHERGILVIVDFVINHTSRDHPWFEDALAGGDKRDWYTWSTSDPGWPPIAGPNPWHRVGETDDHYYGAFWEGMPDLNLRNAEVTAELLRVARFWLDDLDVDGFRIDAAKHLIEVDGAHQANTPETLAWLAGFTDAIHETHPDALVLSEVFDIARTAGGYVPASSDLTFDFGLASAIVSAVQRGRTPPMVTALDETLRFWPRNRAASFLTNHDQNRVMSQLNGDLPAARLAAFMLLASPGVPFVYYGEEIGMQGQKPDERIRTPMQWSAEAPAGGFSTSQPWQPLADDWLSVNVAAQGSDPQSLLSTYRQAISRRAASLALSDGATVVVDGGAEAVIGWLRVSESETMLVVVNASDAAVDEYGLGLREGPLCGVTGMALVGTVNEPGALPAHVAPSITPSGGLEDFTPFPSLGPRSGYVFRLTR